jgi:hypothetical protein
MLKVRKPSNGRGAIADEDALLAPPQAAADRGLEEEAEVETERQVGNEEAGDSPHAVSPEGDLLESSAGAAEYAELGEHVASVLRAANEAAARIRQEAATDAERIAEATRSEAMATLSNANREADRLAGEADQCRVEADEAAKATRRAAEAYGDEQRREAHAQAARIIAEADQEAAHRADALAERHEVLQDHVGRTEERLEQLVAGLRELASRLDEVLHPGAPAADEHVTYAPSAEEAGHTGQL